MTVLNIEEIAGAWFEMEGGGRVQLRSMTAIAMKAIHRQTVEKKAEYKRVEGKAERFEFETVNDDLQSELFWDYIIVGWENLFDSKNTPISCTKENKLLLMSRSAKFANFVSESLKKINDDEAKEAETTLKN